MLGLHELLDPRGQRVRVGIVHHPHQHGVVDHERMRLRDQVVLLGGIEGLLRLVDQRIDLGVLVAAPVDADRRDLTRMEEADDGVERVRGDIGDVVGGDAGVHLVGREDVAQSEGFQRLRDLVHEMLTCYRNRDWDGALGAIERGRKTDEAHSLEYLYNLYEARIQDYKQNPPPEDWNGAYQLLTK